jgi:type IV pilus assembly protein PilC
VLGRCLKALAIARFALGLYLTMEAGTPIGQALRMSLRATNNAAFASQSDAIVDRIQHGDELVTALQGLGLFPADFLMVLETAEISGQVPEVMRKQAQVYHEEAARKLKLLTAIAGILVWIMVATFLIVAIIKLYMSVYAPVFEMVE